MSAPKIHATAEVSSDATVGDGTRVWHQAQIREGAVVGPGCTIGKGVYVDLEVRVGARSKIQNYACLYAGVTLEDGVFVGPGAIFTNDRQPRAVSPDGAAKSEADWTLGRTTVQTGASLGAGAVVLPGLTIGRWALVGAGSLVTRDVPAYGLVTGSPAKRVGWVCSCAERLSSDLRCGSCGRRYRSTDEGLAIAPDPERVIGAGEE